MAKGSRQRLWMQIEVRRALAQDMLIWRPRMNDRRSMRVRLPFAAARRQCRDLADVVRTVEG